MSARQRVLTKAAEFLARAYEAQKVTITFAQASAEWEIVAKSCSEEQCQTLIDTYEKALEARGTDGVSDAQIVINVRGGTKASS